MNKRVLQQEKRRLSLDTFEMLKRLLSQNEFELCCRIRQEQKKRTRIKQIFVWYIR